MESIEAYEQGKTFAAFLDAAKANRDLWSAVTERAPLHEEALERITTAGGQWRLLVLADDWCGDAVNIVPVVAGLVEAAPNLDLRIVGREDFPEIMDRHLTRGARSIPVVILLDEEGRERGWWGPGPRELQAWFEEVGRGLGKEERYREFRRWYARDRGATISEEIADLVWCGVLDAAEGYRGTRPCEGARKA